MSVSHCSKCPQIYFGVHKVSPGLFLGSQDVPRTVCGCSMYPQFYFGVIKVSPGLFCVFNVSLRLELHVHIFWR